MSLVDALTNNSLFQLKDKTTTGVALDESSQNAAKQQDSVTSMMEAFMLDLSPDAKEAMEESMKNTAAAAESPEKELQFSLTKKQLSTIGEILEKYKDAPFTQETYELIQEELEDSNLSPESLMLQDKIKSFNPINILVSALSGDFTDVIGSNTEALETKMDNYMAMIVEHWKEVSTTIDEAEAAEINEDVVNAGSETT